MESEKKVQALVSGSLGFFKVMESLWQGGLMVMVWLDACVQLYLRIYAQYIYIHSIYTYMFGYMWNNFIYNWQSVDERKSSSFALRMIGEPCM